MFRPENSGLSGEDGQRNIKTVVQIVLHGTFQVEERTIQTPFTATSKMADRWRLQGYKEDTGNDDVWGTHG